MNNKKKILTSFWPPPGRQKIKVVTSTVSFFTGIKFQHTSSEDFDGYDFGTHSALYVQNADDITVTDCEFSNVGGIGLLGYNSARYGFQVQSLLADLNF